MSGYKPIASQAYDTIGRTIISDIDINRGLREIRYERIPGTDLMYNTSIFNGQQLPDINGFQLIDAGQLRELSTTLTEELTRGSLPLEIRVISPKIGEENWAVFFRNK